VVAAQFERVYNKPCNVPTILIIPIPSDTKTITTNYSTAHHGNRSKGICLFESVGYHGRETRRHIFNIVDIGYVERDETEGDKIVC
jgi:hypothetical protein